MRSHFDFKDSKNFDTTTPILIIFFSVWHYLGSPCRTRV